MAGWHLIDWRPDNINRLNYPEVWDAIYKNKVIPDGLKKQLLREFPKLWGTDVEFAIYFSSEGYATLSAFADGLAYRNEGVQWSFVGGEKIEKEMYGKRMKFFPQEKDFGSKYVSLDAKISSAAGRSSPSNSSTKDREPTR